MSISALDDFQDFFLPAKTIGQAGQELFGFVPSYFFSFCTCMCSYFCVLTSRDLDTLFFFFFEVIPQNRILMGGYAYFPLQKPKGVNQKANTETCDLGSAKPILLPRASNLEEETHSGAGEKLYTSNRSVAVLTHELSWT